MPQIGIATQLTPGAIAVGTRFQQSAKYKSATVEGIWEIHEYVVDRRIGAKTVEGPFEFVISYTFRDANCVTLLTNLVQIELPNVLQLVPTSLARIVVKRELSAALFTLKRTLERII